MSLFLTTSNVDFNSVVNTYYQIISKCSDFWDHNKLGCMTVSDLLKMTLDVSSNSSDTILLESQCSENEVADFLKTMKCNEIDVAKDLFWQGDAMMHRKLGEAIEILLEKTKSAAIITTANEISFTVLCLDGSISVLDSHVHCKKNISFNEAVGSKACGACIFQGKESENIVSYLTEVFLPEINAQTSLGHIAIMSKCVQAQEQISLN